MAQNYHIRPGTPAGKPVAYRACSYIEDVGNQTIHPSGHCEVSVNGVRQGGASQQAGDKIQNRNQKVWYLFIIRKLVPELRPCFCEHYVHWEGRQTRSTIEMMARSTYYNRIKQCRNHNTKTNCIQESMFLSPFPKDVLELINSYLDVDVNAPSVASLFGQSRIGIHIPRFVPVASLEWQAQIRPVDIVRQDLVAFKPLEDVRTDSSFFNCQFLRAVLPQTARVMYKQVGVVDRAFKTRVVRHGRICFRMRRFTRQNIQHNREELEKQAIVTGRPMPFSVPIANKDNIVFRNLEFAVPLDDDLIYEVCRFLHPDCWFRAAVFGDRHGAFKFVGRRVTRKPPLFSTRTLADLDRVRTRLEIERSLVSSGDVEENPGMVWQTYVIPRDTRFTRVDTITIGQWTSTSSRMFALTSGAQQEAEEVTLVFGQKLLVRSGRVNNVNRDYTNVVRSMINKHLDSCKCNMSQSIMKIHRDQLVVGQNMTVTLGSSKYNKEATSYRASTLKGLAEFVNSYVQIECPCKEPPIAPPVVREKCRQQTFKTGKQTGIQISKDAVKPTVSLPQQVKALATRQFTFGATKTWVPKVPIETDSEAAIAFFKSEEEARDGLICEFTVAFDSEAEQLRLAHANANARSIAKAKRSFDALFEDLNCSIDTCRNAVKAIEDIEWSAIEIEFETSRPRQQICVTAERIQRYEIEEQEVRERSFKMPVFETCYMSSEPVFHQSMVVVPDIRECIIEQQDIPSFPERTIQAPAITHVRVREALLRGAAQRSLQPRAHVERQSVRHSENNSRSMINLESDYELSGIAVSELTGRELVVRNTIFHQFRSFFTHWGSIAKAVWFLGESTLLYRIRKDELRTEYYNLHKHPLTTHFEKVIKPALRYMRTAALPLTNVRDVLGIPESRGRCAIESLQSSEFDQLCEVYRTESRPQMSSHRLANCEQFFRDYHPKVKVDRSIVTDAGFTEVSTNERNGSCHKLIAFIAGYEPSDTDGVQFSKVLEYARHTGFGITFEHPTIKVQLEPYFSVGHQICLHLTDDGVCQHVSVHSITNRLLYESKYSVMPMVFGVSIQVSGGDVRGRVRDWLVRNNKTFENSTLIKSGMPQRFAYNNRVVSEPVAIENRGLYSLIKGVTRFWSESEPHPSNMLNNIPVNHPPGTVIFHHFANCHCVFTESPTFFEPGFPSCHPYNIVMDRNPGEGQSHASRLFRCNCFQTHVNIARNPNFTACARISKVPFVDRGTKNSFFWTRAEKEMECFSETTVAVHRSHITSLAESAAKTEAANNTSDKLVNTCHGMMAVTALTKHLQSVPGTPAHATTLADALSRFGNLEVDQSEWVTQSYKYMPLFSRRVPGTFSNHVPARFTPSLVPLTTPFQNDDILATVRGFVTPDRVDCLHTSRKKDFCTACMNSATCSRCGSCITRMKFQGSNDLRRYTKAFCGFCDETDGTVLAWKRVRDSNSSTMIIPCGVYPCVPATFARSNALKSSVIDPRIVVDIVSHQIASKQVGPQMGGICPVGCSPVCTILDTPNLLASCSSRQFALQGVPNPGAVQRFLNYSNDCATRMALNMQVLGYIKGTVTPQRLANFLRKYDPAKRQRYFDACAWSMSKESHAALGREIGCKVNEMSKKDVKVSLSDMYRRSIFLKNELLSKPTNPYNPDDNAGRIITSCTSPLPNVILGPWVAATQTILKKLWDIEQLDNQMSRIRILFACGRGCDELGDFYSYCFNNYKFLTGLDYKRYDSNQKREQHECESYLYKALGFGKAAMRAFEAQARNVADASCKGERLVRAKWRWRRNSGDPNTTLGNSWINTCILGWAICEFCDQHGYSTEDFLILIGGDDAMIASNIDPKIWQPFVDQLISTDLAMPLAWQLNDDRWCIRFMGALPYPTSKGTIVTGPCFERFVCKIGYMANPNPDIAGWNKGVAEAWLSSFSHVPFIPAFCTPMIRCSGSAKANYKLDGFLYAQSRMDWERRPCPQTSLDVFRRQLIDIGVNATPELIMDMLTTVSNIQALPCLVSHPLLNMVGLVSYD